MAIRAPDGANKMHPPSNARKCNKMTFNIRDASHAEQFMSKFLKLHFKFSSIITQLSWFLWCSYSSPTFAINSFVSKLLSRGHLLKRKQRVNPGVSPNPTPWCLLEWVLECHIPLLAAALSVLTRLAKTRWALVQRRTGTNVSNYLIISVFSLQLYLWVISSLPAIILVLNSLSKRWWFTKYFALKHPNVDSSYVWSRHLMGAFPQVSSV